MWRTKVLPFYLFPQHWDGVALGQMDGGLEVRRGGLNCLKKKIEGARCMLKKNKVCVRACVSGRQWPADWRLEHTVFLRQAAHLKEASL